MLEPGITSTFDRSSIASNWVDPLAVEDSGYSLLLSFPRCLLTYFEAEIVVMNNVNSAVTHSAHFTHYEKRAIGNLNMGSFG